MFYSCDEYLNIFFLKSKTLFIEVNKDLYAIYNMTSLITFNIEREK